MGEVPKSGDHANYGKEFAYVIDKKRAFRSELVVSGKPPPQAATDPLFSGNR